MLASNDNKLNDRLLYALRERKSTITISSNKGDGRITASYIYSLNGKKEKLFVSAETPEKALNSLSRKVHGWFHSSAKSSKNEMEDRNATGNSNC